MPRRPKPRGGVTIAKVATPLAPEATVVDAAPDASQLAEARVALAAPVRAPLDDDRPTEIYDPTHHRSLHTSVDQEIVGSTIEEMMRNSEHKLRTALDTLLSQARRTLPGARVDARATLRLQHEFEFDRRVGYRLWLVLSDEGGRTVEVTAELDQNGRAIRRGSMMSKLITI